MAKGIYIGVSNKARKVTDIYFGVSNKARRVTKAYIGVGGVARLFYSAYSGPVYIGSSSLTNERQDGAVAQCGPYAVFSGGYAWLENGGQNILSSVEFCNTALTVGNFGEMSVGVRNHAGAGLTDQYTSREMCFFAGGFTANRASTNQLYQISRPGTSIGAVPNLAVSRGYLAAAGLDNYIVFAGGQRKDADSALAWVDAYDNSGVKINSVSALNTATAFLAGATLNTGSTKKIIFAGGYSTEAGSAISDANSYDSSLTRNLLSPLSVQRGRLSGASVGNYVLFAGGYYSPGTGVYYNTVDAYNSSLTRSTCTGLSLKRNLMASASTSDYAYFAGGTPPVTNIIDVYDTNLTRTNHNTLSLPKHSVYGIGLNDIAIFAGGYNEGFSTATIDSYGIV